jgi:methionine biosynthesis protein MetW
MSLLTTEAKVSRRRLETISCDLCDSRDVVLKFTARNSEFKETFHLVECTQCGLVYLNPRPTKLEIGKYYPEENYYAYQDLDDESWNNFRQRVKNFILESQPGYSKNSELVRSLIWPLFKRSLMIQVPFIPAGRILDVGCGNGYFLKWMKEHGWESFGVEISKTGSQVAAKNGIKVFNGELEKAKYPSNYFDVVTVNQVLEHVYSPARVIREASRVLRPNGLLVVCVPNLESYEEQIFKQHWYALDVPRHLYFFSIRTLTSLLQKNEFRIEKTLSKSFGLSWVGIRQSLRNLLDDQYGSASELEKLMIQARHYLNYAFKRPLAYLSSSNKAAFGVYISIYARKT